MPSPTTPHAARRILVYGVTGSGKSTAAKRIGARAGLQVLLADEFCWDSNWTPVAPETQRERFAAVADGDAWVLDTVYGTSLELVLLRAELIVGLDYPRWLSLQRLLRRTVRRIVTRERICNGNVETLRRALARDSIMRWHFQSFTRKRRRMRAWAAVPGGPPVLLVRRPRDLERFIASLAESRNPPTASRKR